MKILWVSRNNPTESQVKELKRLFGGDLQLDRDRSPFADADDVIRRIKTGKYDEFVLMAPLSVCRIVTEMGYRPLYSEMRKVGEEDAEVTVEGSGSRVTGNKRYYKFVRFRRLEGIDMIFSDL